MGWSPYPPPTGPRGFRARPGGRAGGAAVLFLLGALVLVAISLALPWFYLSEQGSGSAQVTIDFNLGSQISCTSSSLGSCSHLSYSSDQLNSTGALYGSGFWLGVTALGVVVLGLILAVLVFAGYARRRSLFRALFAVAVTGLLLVLVLALLIPLATPGALHADVLALGATGGGNACGGSSGGSPTQSFWGSCSNATAGLSLSWGAGAGWYLGLISGVLLLLGVLALGSYRRRPVSQEEFAGPSPPSWSAPVAPAAYALLTPGPEWSESPPTPSRYTLCPSCGLPLLDNPSRCPRCGFVRSP